MKKQVLLTGMVLVSGFAFAQQAQVKPQAEKAAATYNRKAMVGNEVLGSIMAPANPYVNNKSTDFELGYPIGNTYYDLQTNGSLCSRIVNFDDNTVAATWTFGSTAPSFAERGTGYNYLNAASDWRAIPGAREEASVRTGWPNIVKVGSTAELVFSHQGTTNTVHVLRRATKGAATWDQDADIALSGLWPRVAVSGNTVHVITNGNPDAAPTAGLTSPLYYHRSTDGGATWSITDQIIPALDSSLNYGFSADGYSIDASGNTVAILVTDDYNPTFLLKSTDGGNNWTRTDIIDPGLGKYSTVAAGSISDVNSDGIADTISNSDASGAVIIDGSGVVHAFFGLMRYLDDDPAADANTSFFPGTNGLAYWRDNNPTQIDTITGALDIDGSGVLLDDYAAQENLALYYQSLSSWPSVGIDASGNLYLAYSAVMETLNDGMDPFQFYRQIYIMKSTDGGNNWDAPYHIPTQFQFGEYIFASINRNITNNVIHIVCQRDGAPGLNVRGDEDPAGDNEILYFQIPTSLPENLSVADIQQNNVVGVYPNPAVTDATVTINAGTAAEATLQVIDITGKTVILRNQNVTAGYNAVNLDVQNLSAGMYSVNVTIGKDVYTQKLIKK